MAAWLVGPYLRWCRPVAAGHRGRPGPFPHAEERRLFYVALTRARRSVLLLTRAGHESPFLLELIQAKALRVRSSAGADITPVTCPKCKKRIMRQRHGKRGPFLGCDGYPLCKGTIDVTSGYVPIHATRPGGR